jgi:hypothetical protein
LMLLLITSGRELVELLSKLKLQPIHRRSMPQVDCGCK